METTSEKNKHKCEVFNLIYAAEDVCIHFDPRREGVIVPAHLRNQSMVSLQFGDCLPIPIRDLNVTDEGITATLSFNRSPFWCSIPWDVIYAITDVPGKGIAWVEDIPEDARPDKLNSAPPTKRHLRVV